MTSTNPPLDPAIQKAVRDEVRLQMAAALESLAAQLRGGACGSSVRPMAIACGQMDPKLLAILTAAAVAAMGGRRLAVRQVTYLNQNTVSGWAEIGRAVIQSSHNLQR